MPSYMEASNAAARTVLCAYFGITDTLGRAVRAFDSRFAVPIPFVYDWFRRLCNQEPPEQPSLVPLPPPFLGGQCPVTYRVYWMLYLQDRPGGPVSPIDLMGYTAGPIARFDFRITNPPFPSATLYGIRSTDSAEFPCGGGSSGSTTTPLGSETRYEILSIVRNDGLPDDCGDLPSPGLPPAEPPPDSNIDFPITYNDNNGDEFNVDAHFVLGNIQLDINGNIIIPFNLSFAPEFNISLNGAVYPNGEVNINYGNPNYNPGGKKYGKRNPGDSVADSDDPEVPPDVMAPTNPPPADENEEEQKPVIRAVIVTTTSVSDHQSIVYQDVNPDIMIPRLGNVAFLIAVGNRVAWTDDIPVRNKRHFIVCPWEGGAIDVRGTEAPGNNFTLTKVYASEQYPVQLLT